MGGSSKPPMAFVFLKAMAAQIVMAFFI